VVKEQPAVATIPIIDVALLWSDDVQDRMIVAQELRAVATDVGFFFIKNHGIPQAMIESQLGWCRQFFALPPVEKERIHLRQSSCMRGYEGLGAQTLDEESPPDLKESFMISRELGEDHPYVVQGIPNYGPNQWPQMEGFEAQMNAYYAALSKLEMRLMRCMALSLDLPETYFDLMYAEPMSILRLLHYPPSSAATHDDQLGAGAHTDWGMLTFLLQDDIGGLQVRAADGSWIPATPIPGTFVVNIGDMVTRMTNGVYRSTMHRVKVNTSGRDRYSVVFFGEPDHHAHIEILSSCIGEQQLYEPCSAGEHLVEMQNKTYAHKNAEAA